MSLPLSQTVRPNLVVVALALLVGCGLFGEGEEAAEPELAEEVQESTPKTASDRLVGIWAFELTEPEKEMLEASRRALAQDPKDPMSRAMVDGIEAKSLSSMEVQAGRMVVRAAGREQVLRWELVEEGPETLTIRTEDPSGEKRRIGVRWETDGVLVFSAEGEADTRFRPGSVPTPPSP